MKKTLQFSECEHYEDLTAYEQDIIASGGKIIDSNVDLEEEMATITFEADDSFHDKFKQTSSASFIW
jgi:hypothetical protein